MSDDEKLALALKALELAESIMGYSRGDAWERECTQSDYDEFSEIYAKLVPPEPVSAEPIYVRLPHHTEKWPCPDCGRKFINVAEHQRAKHSRNQE